MRMARQYSAADGQEEHNRTLLAPDLEEWRSVVTPRVLAPADARQWQPASQSRRIFAVGRSSSHWTPSEVSVAGAPPVTEAPHRAFELVKSWDGIIIGVTDETMIVRIVPLDGVGLEEEAEFLLADVPDEDRGLVRPGAPLFWFVGYETDHGRRRRTSELKMRRLKLAAEASPEWLVDVESIVRRPGESAPTEG